MICEEKRQVWVTSALCDEEAIQAMVLTMSLKNVKSKRKVIILSSEDVTRSIRLLLLHAFDGVVIISKEEIVNAGFEHAKMDFVVKLWCWKLIQYEKCVYLSPNHMVKKFSDKCFNDEEVRILGSSGLDENVIVIKPSFGTFQELAKKYRDSVDPANDSLALKRDQTIVSKRGLGNSAVVHYQSKPWIMPENEQDEEWLQVYRTQVLPLMQMELDENAMNIVNSIVGLHGIQMDLNRTLIGNEESDNANTIAVVGMSCRLPGANSPAEYWKLLSEGREAIRPFPLEREFQGCFNTKAKAGFLNCPVDEFDAKFFGISPREAVMMDPQQRLLLEVTWECLEHAGINPQTLRDSSTTGVYVRMWQQDYEQILCASQSNEDETENLDYLHVFLGNKLSATASRTSFCLGFHGPAVAIESGCSSSLVALHLACESLQNGKTSLALASGVNLILRPVDPFSGKSQDSKSVVLSDDFKCKTFDESADGFVRAEACGVVALKRFADARRDGDKILAIIKGSAINNDGTGSSFGTLNAKAQEEVFRSALKQANVSPGDVSFVETHGTGTAVGDPIEMHAVGQVYSEGRTEALMLGAVKTNIGHCEAAAGIASLIKVILCMEHEAIPPHRNLNKLNPKIDLDSIPARIPMKLTPWTAKPKIAAISAFSMSATNAHVILQEPPTPIVTPSKAARSTPELITLSAKSEEALSALTKSYLEFLKQNPDLPLKDIAYGVNIGRAHLQHRIAIVATDNAQLLNRLEKRTFTQGKGTRIAAKIGFLFTGQGSQYFGMTQGLSEAFPVFQAAMDKCDALFRSHLQESLLNVLFKKDGLLNQTLYCQPAIFCVEYCLVQLWNCFGISPGYVLGHSVGEFAAAVCAGILNLEDAMKLVAERSRLVNKLPAGSMLAIRTSEEKTNEIIKVFTESYKEKGAWIDIAAVNSTEEVVVSVGEAYLQLLETFCSNSRIQYVKIPASHAFHSRDMDPILANFGKVAATVSAKNPNCIYVSGTLAKPMESIEIDSHYWPRHLRDTVRFSNAVQVMAAESKVLIEIGTQPILLSLTMANIQDSSNFVLCPSQRKNEDALTTFFTSLSKLYVSGVDLDWQSVHGIRQKSIHLPMYPFQHQKYWIANDAENEADRNIILHPLLGTKFLSPVQETIFRQTLRTKDLAYLKDHVVAGSTIIPAAAMLECLLAAGREVLQGGARNNFAITIEQFQIHAAFPIQKYSEIQTFVSTGSGMLNQGELKYELTLSRKLEGHLDKWKRHATAQLSPSLKFRTEKHLDLDKLKSSLKQKAEMNDAYKSLANIGIQFGPQFQSIVSAWHNPNEMLVEINLPEGYQNYICHPILIDAMIHAFAFRENFSESDQPQHSRFLKLPVSVRSFTWLSKEPSKTVYAHVTSETGAVKLYSMSGEALAIMDGLELVQTTVLSVVRGLREDAMVVPDFMCEKWRLVQGKTDSRVDLSGLLTGSDVSLEVNKVKEECQGVTEEQIKEIMKQLDEMVFLSLCENIQKLGWPWPEVNGMFYAKQWKKLLPETLNQKLIQIYIMEFHRNGYLTPTCEESYVVLKRLPALSDIPERIEKITRHVKSISLLFEAEISYAQRFRECLALVLQGKMTPLAYLFPEHDSTEGGALQLYTQGFNLKYQNELMIAWLTKTLAAYRSVGSDSRSRNGVLRILEIGAGSGSTTAKCIDVLKSMNVSYNYTFTDISMVFLNEAKKGFGQGPEMNYQLFNIENDPLSQGFMPREFDIIIGSQVLHATASIAESLSNLKKVLQVGGAIVLGEALTTHALHTFPFGLLDGWWRFKDFRLGSPMTALLSAKDWSQCLENAGFDNILNVKTEAFSGLVSARNTSRPAETPAIELQLRKWLVVHDDSGLCSQISEAVQDQGRYVIRIKINTNDFEKVWNHAFTSEATHLEGIICCLTHQNDSSSVVESQSRIVTVLLNITKTYHIKT